MRTIYFADSSQIEYMAWDPNKLTLKVRFKSNDIYFYEGVGQLDFATLCCATSVGSKWAELRKMRDYPYRKL